VSFITGTQTELLYAMPASSTAVTAAAQTLLSANAAANPAYQLPAGFFAPQSGNGPGKSLLLKGGGVFSVGTTAVTDVFTVAIDATAGTYANTIAKTGAFTTVASVANGAFEFELMLTATAVGTSGSLNGVGHLLWGPANNAAAPSQSAYSATLSGQPIMIGTPQTPVSFNNTSAYYLELFNTWSSTTGASTITLTNFLIFGLN
jgi:hypothetical protein